MTNKEASQILADLQAYIALNGKAKNKSKLTQALTRAIFALEIADHVIEQHIIKGQKA